MKLIYPILTLKLNERTQSINEEKIKVRHLCPSPNTDNKTYTEIKVNENLVFNMYSIFSTKHNPRNFCINMNVTNCQATKFTMKKCMPRTTNCSDCIMFSELTLI